MHASAAVPTSCAGCSARHRVAHSVRHQQQHLSPAGVGGAPRALAQGGTCLQHRSCIDHGVDACRRGGGGTRPMWVPGGRGGHAPTRRQELSSAQSAREADCVGAPALLLARPCAACARHACAWPLTPAQEVVVAQQLGAGAREGGLQGGVLVPQRQRGRPHQLQVLRADHGCLAARAAGGWQQQCTCGPGCLLQGWVQAAAVQASAVRGVSNHGTTEGPMQCWALWPSGPPLPHPIELSVYQGIQ